MGTHHVIRDATVSHRLYSRSQCLFVSGKDHIFTRLCSSIAPLQPITVASFLRRNGCTDALHHGEEPASGGILNTLRRIDSRDSSALQPGECLWVPSHREDEVRRFWKPGTIQIIRTCQTVLTDDTDLIVPFLQTVGHSLHDRPVLFHGVRRIALCPCDSQHLHAFRKASAF